MKYKIAIVGGTHGNEFTGVFLVKNWQQSKKILSQYPHQIDFYIANPEAFKQKRRYIDQDLNRSFKRYPSKNLSDNYEVSRAKELIKSFGTKSNPQYDIILDLHTTTANMGKSIVLTDHNKLSETMAAYVMMQDPAVNCYRWYQEGVDEGFLTNCAPHGFAIEIGPIANSILRADIYLQTEAVLKHCLEFLTWSAKNQLSCLPTQLIVHEHMAMIDYPRDAKGEVRAMIHPELQNKDFCALAHGDPVFLTFSGETLLWEGESEVVPVFINEAAYYEKGIAFSVTRKQQINI